MDCKTWVASEFFETLLSSEFHDDGLQKLVLQDLSRQCEPFSNEVLTRLAQACAKLKHFELRDMHDRELSSEGVN